MATTLSKVPRGTVAKRRSANRPLVRLTLLLAVPALTSSSSTSCPRYAGRVQWAWHMQHSCSRWCKVRV